MNLNKITSTPSPESSAPVGGGASGKNVLSADVDIKGTIKFDNELICDGKIEGEIISDGILVIGKNAVIRGEVMTKAVTVHGTVLGNITVSEKAELKASAQLTGDLTASRIVIEEGASFTGKSEVTPNKNSSRPAASSKPADSHTDKPGSPDHKPNPAHQPGGQPDRAEAVANA
jgi:cytoskeletal protein CcmA (bactofilin family)